ncbi:hypothetical protein CDL12_13587 [Handroanthus impetiginosus]|uniref:Uncharacterized protein n=1 Tax=Handroanthus impetiginosus TaxID=429701 RepID=A0A2G9H8E0_9LAMI|nr:hypothetical protein CDL12_13587 [Handroanthus impetiginosus]
MGNCIERCKNSPQKEIIKPQEEEKSGNMRIKIVLTKEELEWLMFELKNREGKRLEDLLVEIQRNREKSTNVANWKPSLDSIVEGPEDIEDR